MCHGQRRGKVIIMCCTGLCKFENYMGDCMYNVTTTANQRALYAALNVTECFVGGIAGGKRNSTYENALLDALTTATVADAQTVLIDLRGP